MSGCGRAPRSFEANAGRVHMIGIAMDVTEQHRLAQRYAEADQRLADAIECTSEAFVLWDKNDRLVMCNAHFQQAYGLPDSILVPGTERAVVNAAAARPVIERRIADADGSGYSRTTEVQLADERWLQINERRTARRRHGLGGHRHYAAEAPPGAPARHPSGA